MSRARTVSWLLACVMSMGGAACALEATTYLPDGHRVYDFIETMEHKYYISGAFTATRPMTRAEAARLLLMVESHKEFLTLVERGEYQLLFEEFAPDFRGGDTTIWDDEGPVDLLPRVLRPHIFRNRRNLFAASGGAYRLYIDPVLTYSTVRGATHPDGADDTVNTMTNGLIVRGTLGGQIGFHVDARDAREWGDRYYPPATATTMPGRGYAAFKGDHAEFDETRAQVTYANGPFVISWTRDRTVWGRGGTGTLLLSSYGAPYDMLRVETVLGRMKFVFFTGQLKQYPPVTASYYPPVNGAPADSVAVRKYISGHRIEVNVNDRLSVGLHETVVFGGRYEWSYLNPLMFLKGAEHANFDHDNAAMGADFRLFVHRAHSVYGELLIDDITTGKLGTDWWGNKIAWQLGTRIIEPFSLHDVHVCAEYTHVDPWVFTHRVPVNTYTHYGDVLGYDAGPNSAIHHAAVRKRFTRRLAGVLAFTRTRHGANPPGSNVGGDALVGFGPGDSTEAPFLDGDVMTSNRLSFDVSYEPAWQVFVHAGYMREVVDGDGADVFRFSIGLNE